MHLSDVLRNDYGINIEQMNRDHPTSLMDRHHALRDALDDYFARHRMDGETDQSRGQEHRAQIDTGAERAAEASPTAENETHVDDAQVRAAVVQAASEKVDSLREAHQYKGETRRDAGSTRAEEATRGREPRPYSRTSDADLAAVGFGDSQAAGVRARTRQNFPQPSTQRVFHSQGPTVRRGADNRSAQGRQAEVTR